MKVLTTKEAAERLGVSERRIRFFCKAGRLGMRLGGTKARAGTWIIPEEELKRFKRFARGRPSKRLRTR